MAKQKRPKIIPGIDAPFEDVIRALVRPVKRKPTQAKKRKEVELAKEELDRALRDVDEPIEHC